MKRRKNTLSLRATLLILLVLLTIGVLAQSGQWISLLSKVTMYSSPTSHAQNNSIVEERSHNALETWQSSFQYQDQIYHYSMVGTDAAQGSRITMIPVTIIPLKMVFGNVTYDGSKQVAKVLASPIFQTASFTTGYTQYVDAIQRAEFWQWIQKSSPDYHLFLRQPVIANTFTLEVSANNGGLITIMGGQYGNISSGEWWKQQLQHTLDAYQVGSGGLTLFLTENILIHRSITGFHSVEGRGVPGDTTYVWASVFNPAPAPFMADVAPLSHEVAEWANDPYVHNIVPDWIVPDQMQYGCMQLLEVADPLVGTVFHVKGYTLQDSAFFSWFARQPSIGYHTYYSYLGTFKTHPGAIFCS